MNKRINRTRHNIKRFGMASLVVLVLIFGSCKNQVKEQLGANEYYVCSMDPQVMEKQAGPCPICKMPLTKSVIDKSRMDIIMLNSDQQLLGNIKVEEAGYEMIGRENMLTGAFAIDQNRTEQVSTRGNGRIEQLYYKNIGERIVKGDKIYDLYSEELLLAQEEYLLALEKNKLLGDAASGILNAAKNKLLLWGWNDKQVNELAEIKITKAVTTIYSKVSGTITDIPMREGDYVNTGTAIYKLADLSKLWVEAQLYTNEFERLQEGKRVEIIPEGYAGERIMGIIVFTNPELQAQSKINLIRAEVDNNGQLFKPGMQAGVVLKSEEKKALVLPMDAVIQTGGGAIVWLQNAQEGFEARAVQLGIQNQNRVEIISGIKEGDKIVITGANALNGAYVFKHGVMPKGTMLKM